MSDHKFAVGESVEFSPDWLVDNTTKGQYTIVRLYPKTGNTPQYRIKSKRDGHERMVQEDRLDRATKVASLADLGAAARPTVPAVQMVPATSIESLILNGTP